MAARFRSSSTLLTSKMLRVLLILAVSLDLVCGITSSKAAVECQESEFQCKDQVRCIPSRWQCDGETDCEDQSDEDPGECGTRTCAPDQFACIGNSSMCIPADWKCDGQPECPDQSDEKDCSVTECTSDEFKCKRGGQCITNRWKCDSDKDCGDGSDEDDCGTVSCAPEEFMCGSVVPGSASTPAGTKLCIPSGWKCDGDSDCKDGSDELNCESSHEPTNRCSATEFMCHDLDCIHKSWQCDGDKDCIDGSDELNCGLVACPTNYFRCEALHLNSTECIQPHLRCNGMKDCNDMSDEKGCPPIEQRCDPHYQFDCDGGGKNCINITRLCDKLNDCAGDQDEDLKMCSKNDTCQVDNGGCLQICVFTHAKHYCACNPGYELTEDDRSCRDIDECATPGACSQMCMNTKGGYKCECMDGYQVDPSNHRFCRASGHEPSLLFANRKDLRQFRLQTGHHWSILESLRAAIALDFDFEESTIYYSDVAVEEIRTANVSPANRTQSQQLVKDSVNTPDGLALDWVHKNLYWTDTGLNHIEVMSVSNHSKRKTLFSTDLDEPRAIVVDPREDQGWIYWTDWGSKAKIEKAGLNGEQRKTIVNSSIEWPNGMTIDYHYSDGKTIVGRLYWVDAKLHIIGSSNLEGGDRNVILSSFTHLKHPFAITVFEDWLYWTDWETESIHKVVKFSRGSSTSNEPTNVAINLYSPMDLHIFHSLKQPAARDRCVDSGCSHMCLPAPYSPNGNIAVFTCVCPNHVPPYKLHSDGKTCILQAAPSPSSPGVGIKPPNSVVTRVPISHITIPGAAGNKNQSQTSNNGGGKSMPSVDGDVGKIAGIVIGIIGALAIITAIIGYFVYRSLMRRSIKSMNFDNPVYRKTTEDQFALEKNQYQPSKSLPPTLEPLTAGTNDNIYV